MAAVPAYPSGLVGSNVIAYPIGYAPILARVTSMLEGSPGPLEELLDQVWKFSLRFHLPAKMRPLPRPPDLKDLSSGPMKPVCLVPEYNHSLMIEEPENEAEDANHLQQHRY